MCASCVCPALWPIELELELELELETGNIGDGVLYSGRRDWCMNADPPPIIANKK